MRIRSLFNPLTARHSRKPSQRMVGAGPPIWLRLEALEHRTVPSFTPAAIYPAGWTPQAVVTGDFNGDSRLDLATAEGGDVRVLLGQGDGSFHPAATYATGASNGSLAVGDLDGDGKLDLAIPGLDDVRVLFGDGDGGFRPVASVPIGSHVDSVAVGDLNADGKLDLAVISNLGWYDYDSFYQGIAHVLLGDGQGNFAAPNSTLLGSGWHSAIALADFNGDGVHDLATSTDFGAAGIPLIRHCVLLNNGSGTLQAPNTYFGDHYWSTSLAAGDVNGDGKADLATNAGIFLGDGNGGFGLPRTYLSGQNVALADFNYDGHLDLAASARDRDTLSVALGRGDGTFLTPINHAVNHLPGAIATGDLNGDGWLDVALGNSYGYNMAALMNDHAWPRADEPALKITGSTVMEGNAGVTNAIFTVSLSKPYGQPVTVEYLTGVGTATPGVDYQAVSGTLTFAPGQTSRTFEAPVYGDRTPEAGEYFDAWLRNPSNATLDIPSARADISEDEPEFRIVEQGNVTVNEGNSGITQVLRFTVTKSRAYDVDVTVDFGSRGYTASHGSDYLTGGTLTFAPAEFSKTFDVTIFGDRLAEQSVYSEYDPDSGEYVERTEPHEYFSVELFGSNYGRLVGGTPRIYIQDDEPHVTIADTGKYEGRRGQTTLLTFTVRLSIAYDQPVTMSYRTFNDTATSGSGDYVAKTGTLTFAPGETTKTITIEVKGDNKREGHETFWVELYGASLNALFTKNFGRGTILNDD